MSLEWVVLTGNYKNKTEYDKAWEEMIFKESIKYIEKHELFTGFHKVPYELYLGIKEIEDGINNK